MVLIKISTSQLGQLDSIVSDKEPFEENEKEIKRTKSDMEMSLKPKKKAGRPKGSKNVRKEKLKQEIGQTKSEENQNIGLGGGILQPCDMILAKTESNSIMLTENLVEAVLSEIEPGEIVDGAKFNHAEKEI